MKNEHGCNRCQYTWEGNNGICPICGNSATHYLVLPIALLNTSIATADGTYTLHTVSLNQAKDLVKGREILSAIGHASTAQILTEILGIDVPVNRIQFEQQPDQSALVFKLKGRPEEGKILSREEIEQIGYEFKVMTRTA
jgi:hypothetical protein